MRMGRFAPRVGRIALGAAILLLGSSAIRAQQFNAPQFNPSPRPGNAYPAQQNQAWANQPSLERLSPPSGAAPVETRYVQEQVRPSATNLGEDEVRRIVDDYLREQDEKKQAEAGGFQEVVNNPLMQGKYDNGWLLSSPDKAFTIRAGAECQADAVWMGAANDVQFGAGGVGPVTNGVNIRRGRLDARGTIYENFQYMVQYDFNLATSVNGQVFNSPQPTEFWGMFTNLPFARNIRIGNQKPLWSFENWTSSRFQNFMERSLGWDAFVEDQNNGFIPSIVMLNWTENERMTFQAGVAKNNRSGFFYNQQDSANMAEGRFSILPYYADDGRYLLHFGLGGMYASTDRNIARFRSRTLLRGGSNQTQNIMTEARMYGGHEARLAPEFVMNLGSMYIQGEYYMAWVTDARTIADPNTNLGTWYGDGYYVQVMYFLTGEYNPYNRQLGRFERVVPNTNFFWMRSNGRNVFGSGCWLTGVRFSSVDLRGLGGVNGANVTPIGAQPSSARVYDISAALNWIVNPNARIVWDAIYEYRNPNNPFGTSNGSLAGAGMRMQFDF